jgi:hypothetical protein
MLFVLACKYYIQILILFHHKLGDSVQVQLLHLTLSSSYFVPIMIAVRVCNASQRITDPLGLITKLIGNFDPEYLPYWVV